MSDVLVYEGKYQWPTKGEIISAVFMGILIIFFTLIAFVEPSAAFLPIMFGTSFLAIFFLGKKVRLSGFANVYKDRVEVGSTFFRLRMSRIEASKIESVSMGQAVLGKSNYGNVMIGGSGGVKLRVANLRNPEAFVEAVKSVSSAPIAKNSHSGGESAAGEIAKLDALFQAGVISKEDFEKGKNKALGI